MSQSLSSAFVTALRKVTKVGVRVVGESGNMREMQVVMERYKPDVVFHDPMIDEGEMLKTWKLDFGLTPALVCVTNELQYAVDAFEAGAVHYLVPPLTSESLSTAITRVSNKLARLHPDTSDDALAKDQYPFRKRILALPSQHGIDVRGIDEVVCVNGEGNYARVVLNPDGSLLLSRSLGELEERLVDAGLLRVHRSHIVNVNHIRQLKRGKSPVLRMSNGDEIDVSTSYRDFVMDLLQVRPPRRQER
ncbi:MAG: response regulator transcription factor [Ignavibacteria bacterium]|nr:response regulator transcription factor [Ignavibacteria bacterium]